MACVVVELAVLVLGRGPGFPAIGLVEDVGVFLPVQRGLVGPVLFQPVEVFQEQQPGGLLGVVQLGGASGLFPEDIVDVLEGLFEHGVSRLSGVEEDIIAAGLLTGQYECKLNRILQLQGFRDILQSLTAMCVSVTSMIAALSDLCGPRPEVEGRAGRGCAASGVAGMRQTAFLSLSM